MVLVLVAFYLYLHNSDGGRCASGDCDGGTGVMFYPDGTRYQGQFASGQRHGQGTLESPQVGRYEGTWRYGYREGSGVARYPDDSRYEGEFVANERQGRGTLYYPDGTRYSGDCSRMVPVQSGFRTDENCEAITLAEESKTERAS